jgi:hypothetical protein
MLSSSAEMIAFFRISHVHTINIKLTIYKDVKKTFSDPACDGRISASIDRRKYRIDSDSFHAYFVAMDQRALHKAMLAPSRV